MSISLSDDIRHALSSGTPVVALETAVLTSGLPRTPWCDTYGECPAAIDENKPINSALASLMTNAVLENGATPAWIAVVDGVLRIGLPPKELVALCTNSNAGKVSIATFAQTLDSKKTAGTTVASTLLACKLASPEHPIRVFATGGIGGIHQKWTERLDVSADLLLLATTPTCVVSSGAKSILDIPATVESLETIGVPVLGLGTTTFPRFIEKKQECDPAVYEVHSPLDVATLCKKHWQDLRLPSAVLATVPVPAAVALEDGVLAQALVQAEQDWVATNQPSATRTPFLLDQIATITQGKSLVANLALLCNNAQIAAKIAVAM